MALTLEKIKIQPIKVSVNKTFMVLILDATTKNNSTLKLLGREPKYWVKFASRNYPSKIIGYTLGDNVLETIEGHIDDKYDYTIVLLSYTPLLEVRDIDELKDYATYKGINLCKLPVGYIVNNKYYKSTKEYMVDSIYTSGTDNFYIVENKKQYKYALEILQDRINNFHIDNGVEIVKPSSVYIEPEVDIADGVSIQPRVSLKGETRVDADTIIKDGAVIENTTIGSKCYIGGSVIENSDVADGVCIGSFCNIINCKIGKNTTIESGCNLNGCRIKSGEKIKANTNVGDTNDSSSGIR